MVAASLAWELADNTGGRFRLGLGSQVRAHVERRYGAEFDPPVGRMRDYVRAVKAALAAFRGDADLAHDGPYYNLSLLPDQWRPLSHGHGDIKVDVSAVGPAMTKMAGAVADGIHVHPVHSVHYLNTRLLPSIAEGAATVGRDPSEVDLLIPSIIVPGDTPEERADLLALARTRIGFYGATKNYAYQFDDLGFDGTSAELNRHLKAGDVTALAATIMPTPTRAATRPTANTGFRRSPKNCHATRLTMSGAIFGKNVALATDVRPMAVCNNSKSPA